MGPKNSKPDRGRTGSSKKAKLDEFKFEKLRLPNVSLVEDPMVFKDMDSHRQVSNYMDNVDVLTFEGEP